MAITLASFLVLSWCGHAAIQCIAGFWNSRINPLISWGLGFFLSTATIIFWLSASPFSISTSSKLLALLGLFVVMLRAFSGLVKGAPKLQLPLISLSLFEIGLLMLLMLHMGLILVAQASDEIFPWDALTTWIYRAKAWALADYPVSFQSTASWLAQSTAGYTLEAAHYPISVSAISAFASSVAGGWQLQLAVIPWLLVSMANGALMMGLCRQCNTRDSAVPLVGATLLLTTPLINLHGILAGYADIWMQGTSGMGLAGLCIWSQRQSGWLLVVSLTLLCLGTVFKSEGWLWLGIGVVSLTIISLSPKGRIFALLLSLAVFGLMYWLTYFDLGALGAWGYSDNSLFFGPLGTIALRYANPFGYIFDETILRGNYLLLVPVYVLCVGWSLMRGERQFFGHWLVGFLTLGSLLFIFGLSSYSAYAEIGTAFNRLLLQILPVLVIGIVALAGQIFNPRSLVSTRMIAASGRRALFSKGLLLAIISILLSVLLLPRIWPTAHFEGKTNTANEVASYNASAMESVAGDLMHTGSGYQFTDPDTRLGVVRIEIEPAAVQPQYIHLHIDATRSSVSSFYWINAIDTRVHAIRLATPGKTLLDMSEHPDFWQIPIKEMGYLVPREHFDEVIVRSIGKSDSLGSSYAELANLWTTPAKLGQKTINGIDGQTPSPINFNAVLVFALALLVFASIIAALFDTTTPFLGKSVIAYAIAGLWLSGSLLHLQQATAYVAELPNWSSNLLHHKDADLQEKQIAALIKSIDIAMSNSSSQSKPPHDIKGSSGGEKHLILVAGRGPDGRFNAHKFPLMILPTPSAKIELSQLEQLSPNTKALLVFFDSEQPLINPTIANNQLSLDPIDAATFGAMNVTLWWVKRS